MNRMILKREDEIRIAVTDGRIDADTDGDWQDFATELLRELDETRRCLANAPEPPIGTVVEVNDTRWERVDYPGFMSHRQWSRIFPEGYEYDPETWSFLVGCGRVRIISDALAPKET